MKESRVVVGRRRFTCLSPTLVRMEYAPDGRFEDRRSMVAHAKQVPLPFVKVERRAERPSDTEHELVLDTGALQIHASGQGDPFDRLNLELRWCDGKLCQPWRPDDRDYQNLGGTLRSLDRYGGDSAKLDGVQTAGMEPSDAASTLWPAWLQCEVDPLYDGLHPAKPEGFNKGHWLREAQRERNDGRFLQRTFNWYKEARRFCPGVWSASGYYFLNDSLSAVLDRDGFPVERRRPGCQDWYFFAYGRDYRRALADFRLLSGPASLPPRRSLGIIFSRWPAFTDKEIREHARAFRAAGYPLATIVMDMEWHQEGWGHWDFNPELIPDPDRFFGLCRKLGLDTVFNDHPLDVREDDSHFKAYLKKAGPGVFVRERDYNGKKLKMAKVDITDKSQNRAFLEVCSRPILKKGLDYWWNDGSRGQLSATAGQLVTNKTFFEASARDGRRGMLLARYGGLGSHRYGAFFTGDTTSDFDVLRLQVEFNIRAAGVGISSVSHDIGGFCLAPSRLTKNAAGTPIIDPLLYLRWLQFGAFNPILRFHSAPGCGSRRPDDYDGLLGGACRKWLRVRHSLLPYLYTAMEEHVRTGVPVTRGLFLDDPENAAAYRFDEFRFGPSLLVAPVVSDNAERSLYLPPGRWWEFGTGRLVEGGAEITRTVAPDDMPVYAAAGAVVPRQDPDGDIHAGQVAGLVLDVYAGAEGGGELFEDDGLSEPGRAAAFCRSAFVLKREGSGWTVSGSVVGGRPLKAKRRLTVEFTAEEPVGKALFNGRAVKAEPAGDNRVRFRLPDIKAADAWSLRIEP